MALWGLNDNLASPGTVTMSWTKETGTGVAGTEGNYTITGSGTSFGYVGCGTVGDIIRLGVKGGEGGYGDYFGDATIVAVASSTSISIADTSSLLNVAIAATDYYISQLPKFTTQDGAWSEANTAEPELKTHLIDNAYAAMSIPTGLVTGELGSRNVPVYLGGVPGVPEGVDIQVGDTVTNDGNNLAITGVGTVLVTASEFNTGTNNQTIIGINTGSYVDFAPLGGSIGATLQNGSANLIISAIGSSTVSVATTTNTGIDTSDTLVINTIYGVSVASTLTADIAANENLTFKRVVAGIDKTVYGIGQTVGAGVSAAPGTLAYTTQGGGWVGVTTYMDCQGNLRVKQEILVATSSGNPGSITGVSTGSNGLLFPTNLG
tara:strand:+ start:549 stop:1679 length:1131 start_codon:yes stop_codon:yes gene_type:complete